MDKRAAAALVVLIALAISSVGMSLVVGAQVALPEQTPANRPTSVSGTVTLENGSRPGADRIAVLVFPAGGATANDAPAPDASRTRSAIVVDGNFSIVGLPPGNYRLTVVAANTVAEASKREALAQLERTGLPFSLGPGEATTFAIVASAADSPRIVNARRESVANVRVGPGGVTLPGRSPSSLPDGSARPTSPGSISGVITGSDGKPVEHVQVFAARRGDGPPQSATVLPFRGPALTDATGAYRVTNVPAGPYVVVAVMYARPNLGADIATPLAVPAVSGADGRRTTVLTTFYPGNLRAVDARTIDVTTVETRGIDFVVRRGELTTIRGVVPQSGEAFNTLITLTPESVPDQLMGQMSQRSRVAADGSFVLPDVPSGRYVITMNDRSGWIRQLITVDAGASPSGVDLALTRSPNLQVRGRLERYAKRAGTDASAPLVISLRPATVTVGVSILGTRVPESGEFVLAVPPGDYVFNVMQPNSWQVVSGTIGDRDTVEGPVTIDRDRDDAFVILSDMPTGIRGNVASATGGPVQSGLVVIFPEDPKLRTPGSSRIRMLTLNPGGTFSATGIPPGRYLVALAPHGVLNDALLIAVTSGATTVEVVPGEIRAVSLVVR